MARERARRFEEDFEACIAHLRLPLTRRRFIRTTNLLKRLFVRRAPTVEDHSQRLGEKPVLKLMFSALIRAAEPWRGLRFTELEIDEEYEALITPLARSSQPRVSGKSAP